MDIDALHSALLSLTILSKKLRLAQEQPARTDLARTVNEAELELRVVEATLAGELGFNLCPRCWPPEFLTTNREGHVHCPACGQISYEKAA